jgi:cellulose synthase (UDP-forming)
MMIAGAAMGAVAERRQPDRHPRLGIDRAGVVMIAGDRYPVRVRNVSAGGCAFVFTQDAPPGLETGETFGRLYVKPMPGAKVLGHSLPVRFKHVTGLGGEPLVGAEFDDLQAREYYVLAELMYGDSDALPRFLASRRNHKNLLVGSAQFIWWGLSEPCRAICYAVKKLRVAPAPAIAAASEGADHDLSSVQAAEIVDASVAKLRQMVRLAFEQNQDARLAEVVSAKSSSATVA